MTTSYSTVGGGLYNRADFGIYATVAGGDSNYADDRAATVGGGRLNVAYYPYATVAGGELNYAWGTYSTVGGGFYNIASGLYSTVCGGDSNYASARSTTIGGGYYNLASDSFATVGGGRNNLASGLYSTVPGGWACTADAPYSFATGYGSCSHNPGGEFPASNNATFNGQYSTFWNEVRCDYLHDNYSFSTLDHPLDPDGKSLALSGVGSPDIMVILTGEATVGADGRCEAQLPDYFDALVRNPRVQLTGVGSPEIVYVADDVKDNQFVIGGKPGMKVYWTVTGVRKDQIAEVARHVVPVEAPKTGGLQGRPISDDNLVGHMAELQRLGLGSEFSFRTAAGRQRYENMLETLREAEQHKSVQPVQPRLEPKQLQQSSQPQKLQQQ